MPGYFGTSSSVLELAVGAQGLITQSALAYIPGDTLQLTYVLNTSIYMVGTVTVYNAVTGAMTVNITLLTGGLGGLQPVWNTQLWGETGGALEGWTLSLLQGVSVSTTPVIPTILVRTLDSTWDPVRGNGLSNFLTDLDAVAQIVAQRLKLLQGEWFENTSLGLPLFQSILGVASTSRAVSLLIQQQILGTPYVTGINSFSIAYGAGGRTYQFSAQVQTAFGPLTVSNTPNT
jgi:hypothetical protein